MLSMVWCYMIDLGFYMCPPPQVCFAYLITSLLATNHPFVHIVSKPVLHTIEGVLNHRAHSFNTKP